MDPATTASQDSLFHALTLQGATVGRHEQTIQTLLANQQTMMNLIVELRNTIRQDTPRPSISNPVQYTTTTLPPPVTVREAHIPDPNHSVYCMD